MMFYGMVWYDMVWHTSHYQTVTINIAVAIAITVTVTSITTYIVLQIDMSTLPDMYMFTCMYIMLVISCWFAQLRIQSHQFWGFPSLGETHPVK